MQKRKGVIAYLLIAFGMAWALWEIVIALGLSVTNPLFQIAILPGAFAPAIATFVVRKWITREGFADAGLRLDFRKWPYYIVAWLLPLAVVGCIIIAAGLFGIGTPDFSLARGIKYMSTLVGGAPAHVPPHPWLLIFVFPVTALFAT